MSAVGELYRRCVGLGLKLEIDEDGDMTVAGPTMNVNRVLPEIREHYAALRAMVLKWEDAAPRRH